jgi:hypothetical protein
MKDQQPLVKAQRADPKHQKKQWGQVLYFVQNSRPDPFCRIRCLFLATNIDP